MRAEDLATSVSTLKISDDLLPYVRDGYKTHLRRFTETPKLLLETDLLSRASDAVAKTVGGLEKTDENSVVKAFALLGQSEKAPRFTDLPKGVFVKFLFLKYFSEGKAPIIVNQILDFMSKEHLEAMAAFPALAPYIPALSTMKKQDKAILNLVQISYAAPLLVSMKSLIVPSIVLANAKMQLHIGEALKYKRGTVERNGLLDKAEAIQRVLAFFTGQISAGMDSTKTLVVSNLLTDLTREVQQFNKDIVTLNAKLAR